MVPLQNDPLPAIVVTGLGLVTPLGSGGESVWRALVAGRSGVGEIRTFDPGPGRPRLAAAVADFPARERLPATLLRRMDRLSKMIATASAIAAADAELFAPGSEAHGEDFGVVVGSALGNISETAQFLDRVFTKGPALANPMLFPNLVMNAAASQVAIALGWRGPNLTVSAGELSGELAFDTGAGLVRRRRAAAVVVAAGDELAPIVFRVLKDSGYLSPRGGEREWSSPFDDGANGPLMGEGAAALVLELAETARRRSVRPYAQVAAIRHFAAPCESPYRWPEAVEPIVVDPLPEVVFSGADSSPERDRLELTLASEATGAGAPVYSAKGSLGAYGSFGLTNVALAALCLRTGTLAPLVDLERPRAEVRVAYPKHPVIRAFGRALVTGISRGGAGAAVELERAG